MRKEWWVIAKHPKGSWMKVHLYSLSRTEAVKKLEKGEEDNPRWKHKMVTTHELSDYVS